MEKVRLQILGLTFSHSKSGAYNLILGEVGSPVKLPVMIGNFEAHSIAIKLEGIKMKRPLTHDLIINLLEALHVKLIEVIISSFREGVFYADLVLEKEDGEVLTVDARTSDAIALAVRAGVPIYTFKDILDEAGLVLEEEEPEKVREEKETSAEKEGDKFARYSIAQLEKLMQEAVEEENFEYASQIRDEIKKRKSSES